MIEDMANEGWEARDRAVERVEREKEGVGGGGVR